MMIGGSDTTDSFQESILWKVQLLVCLGHFFGFFSSTFLYLAAVCKRSQQFTDHMYDVAVHLTLSWSKVQVSHNGLKRCIYSMMQSRT